MAEQLTAETFQPLVGQAFKVRDGRHALTLATVDAGPPQPGWERAPFNLIFQGPPDHLLPEGLYGLEAQGGEAFDLYLIPVHTPAPGRQDYQAAFN